ncbi:19885_t:CDS:2 [Cetraspora pellucida]|uniref:19885_t:CDS:1 n=1 Tax=Cetraspora pellucida TaxID=1433469 RepID=A0A9N9IEV4_9GLOM|nr:19885_t:CDS:2 [Cetraspora pellucida]
MIVDSEDQFISKHTNSNKKIDIEVIEIDDEETIQSNLQNLKIKDNEINENSKKSTKAIAEFDAGNLKRLKGKSKIS